MSQHEKILKYMEANGSITPMEAFSHLFITKLATRISEMIRMGIEIEKIPETYKNAQGETVRFMRYRKAA